MPKYSRYKHSCLDKCCHDDTGLGICWRSEFKGYYVAKSEYEWARILFCPFCGEELINIRAESLFLSPDATEIIALKKIMEGIKSIDQLIDKIGVPDDLPNDDHTSAVEKCDRYLARNVRYWRLWRTLCVDAGYWSDSHEFGYVYYSKADFMR